MLKRMKRVNTYLLYEIAGGIVYGLVLYVTFTWLAGYSLLGAYLWNLAFIVFGLAMDFYSQKMLQSTKLITWLKEAEDTEESYRLVQRAMKNSLSFKTILYAFYILILIVSQVIEFYPALGNENLRIFILANSYNVLFLVAVDTLIGQLIKDREKMERLSKQLEEEVFE
ncbi:MAG: hypothetical protein FWG78_00225 [Coriobacteriia bacterium]|nr:hypothetical protein [Coriobacteriia bacterium]